MRPAARLPLVAAALAGPTVLAFFAGGYFDTARLVAAIAAWALVLVAALTSAQPLPAARAGRVAVVGLVLLAAWTAVSFAWAPLSDPAAAAVERLLLYVGALIAAAALLRGEAVRRWAEPALAAGTAIVIGYALAGRFLPGIVHQAHSISAGGRLEQPLTYWNAMGALGAIGLILAVRVSGEPSRPTSLRTSAAAVAVMLGLGTYLSFSRGALAALAIGAVTLIALVPTRPQLRALAIALVGAGCAAALTGALASVRTLGGSLATREREGAAMLGALAGLCALAAAAQWYSARSEATGGPSSGPLPRPRHSRATAAAAIVLLFVGLVAYAASDKGRPPATGANPARLGSLESNRYAYWGVALRDGFAKRPLNGLGAGGFSVAWLQHRSIRERTRVAHSLYIEMLAELGLVGFALLAVFYGGIAASARRAYRADPLFAAGAAAALVTYAAHAAVDWDWEMPALTLVAIALAGLLIAAADRRAEVGEGVAAVAEAQPAPVAQ